MLAHVPLADKARFKPHLHEYQLRMKEQLAPPSGHESCFLDMYSKPCPA